MKLHLNLLAPRHGGDRPKSWLNLCKGSTRLFRPFLVKAKLKRYRKANISLKRNEATADDGCESLSESDKTLVVETIARWILTKRSGYTSIVAITESVIRKNAR